MDGNEPQFVMLPYENYEKIETGENVPIANSSVDNPEAVIAEPVIETYESYDQKTVDRLNQEIMSLKEEIRQKEAAELLEGNEEAESLAETVDLN